MLRVDGFNDCIIGICMRAGQSDIIAYDKVKVLAKLESDGMDADDTLEWFTFNILGSHMGEETPCFIERLCHEDIP